MEKKDFAIQYERLQKHYNEVINKFNMISLLDMTHTLRIFCDMKQDIEHLNELNKIEVNFKHIKNNSKIKKIFKDSEFIYTPITTGINTNGLEIKGITISNKALTEEEIKKLYGYELEKNIMQESNYPFINWLGAEFLSFKINQMFSISREDFIRRIANMLGASHPRGFEKGNTIYDTESNKLILKMEECKVANGYPYSYYCLIEIAKNILDAIKCI